MNYYISDLHLFHKNMTREGKNFENRPFNNLEEMHSFIKSKWNQKITNGDTVYIIGDMSIRGTNENLISFVSTLKGHKVLIRGNHDDTSDYRYKQLFDEVCEYKEIKDDINNKERVKLVLCHYPILMWRDQHNGTILLYGHTHNSIEDVYFKKCLEEIGGEDFKNRRTGNKKIRAYNVGCMMPYINYEPRTLLEIIESVENINSFID